MRYSTNNWASIDAFARTRLGVAAGAVFLLALAIRLAMTGLFVGFGAPPDAEANSDQIDYEAIAYHLSIGEGYAVIPGRPTATRTPGASLALLPVYAAAGRDWAAGRIFFCAISAATCSVVAVAGAVAFGPVVGLLGGLALAMYPGHAYYAMHFLSETPYGLWLSLAVLFTLLGLRGGLRWHVAAGACVGMAILTRPQLAAMVPLALVVAAVAWWRGRRVMLGVATQTLLVALVLSPWVVRNAVVIGKPTLTTTSGYGFWGAHNEVTFGDPAAAGDWVKTSSLRRDDAPAADEVGRDRQAKAYAWRHIREHADEVPRLVAMKLWRLVSPWKSTPNRAVRLAFAAAWMIVGPLATVGAVCAIRTHRREAVVLLLPIATTIGVAAVFYGSDRIRDSCAAVFAILTAVGAVEIARAVRVWWRPMLLAEDRAEPQAA